MEAGKGARGAVDDLMSAVEDLMEAVGHLMARAGAKGGHPRS